jgi:hypothetical protein
LRALSPADRKEAVSLLGLLVDSLSDLYLDRFFIALTEMMRTIDVENRVDFDRQWRKELEETKGELREEIFDAVREAREAP